MKRIVFVAVLLVLSVVVILNLNGNITGKFFGVVSCSDSDGGKNPGEAGIVEVKTSSSQKLVTYADKCVNKKILLEYYCNKFNYKSRTESVPCQDDCQEGACTPLYK